MVPGRLRNRGQEAQSGDAWRLTWREQSPSDLNAGGTEMKLGPALTEVRLWGCKSDCNLEEIPFEDGVSL